MTNFRFGMILKSINTILFLALLSFKFFPSINNVAVNSSGNDELQVVIFMGLYFAVGFVIGLFTSYYDKFVIEEKFGFNKSTKKTFVLGVNGFSLIFWLVNVCPPSFEYARYTSV